MFKRKHLSIPYIIFMLAFVVLPLLVVFYYAFTDGEGKPTFENFTNFFTSGNTIGTLIYSFVIAITVTLVCLLIAYPVAFALTRINIRYRAVMLMLFVIPMWINFTLRITAIKELLTYIEGNLSFHPFINTVIGMSYDFLPFMILPLYTSLDKIDQSLIEASYDLGATHKETFLKVIMPLSVPGIISGVTMVLLPAMTNYVVLDMLYNSTYIMGSLIGSYFAAYDWHNGSMIAIVLLMIIAVISMITNHFGEGDAEERGTIL